MSVKPYNDEPYLRAEDLLVDERYSTFTLEIVAVLSGAPLTRRLRPVTGYALAFKGCQKVLGLGATNEALIKVITGDSRPAKWIGRTVTLEVRRVRSARKGETQPAIRLMPKVGTEMRSGLKKELGDAYIYEATRVEHEQKSTA